MKATAILSACLLLALFTSCSNGTTEATFAEDSGKYHYLPTTADVFISGAVADSINAAISKLDKNMFSGGRTYKQATDTLLAQRLVEEAEHSGGSNSAGTVFKDGWFDDHITVSITTEYDPESLKLLKEWDIPVNKEFTEPAWSYAAKIRINYTVTVDEETCEGEFSQQSQINSPFDLQR